jgi:hypothetical protein
MVFGNEAAAIPEGLITDEFLIRPLSVTDVALDYAAVMESREILRQWEQSSWPADDFTLDGNLKDLDRHEGEHLRRESFTFTVMNPGGTECLGCIYIFPRTARWLAGAETTALGPAAWADYEAVVLFWVRASRLAEGMDRRLLDVLRPWLAAAWAFEGHLFQTSEAFAQQVGMFEAAGLQRRFEVQLPKHALWEFAYG